MGVRGVDVMFAQRFNLQRWSVHGRLVYVWLLRMIVRGCDLCVRACVRACVCASVRACERASVRVRAVYVCICMRIHSCVSLDSV